MTVIKQRAFIGPGIDRSEEAGTTHTEKDLLFTVGDGYTEFQTNPKGIFVSTELILAFNPDYLTKFDKIYKVQCFYMEMNRKLTKEVDVRCGL